MPKVKIYNQEGNQIGDEELKGEIFGVAVKQGLVQQAVEAQLANQRKAIAHTKGRSEKRGGGRKPWRQKGTGRARHGSIRSPLWKGGGITFGPTKEASFKKKINKKAKRKALLMSLSDKVKSNKLFILEDLKLEEAKTKKLREVLNKLITTINKGLDKKTENKDSILLVVKPRDQLVFQASRNLPRLKVLVASSMNIYDILKYKYIFLTKKGLEIVYKTFSSSLKAKENKDNSSKK
jgi:large subunit ribosomal protein L4